MRNDIVQVVFYEKNSKLKIFVSGHALVESNIDHAHEICKEIGQTTFKFTKFKKNGIQETINLKA
jgi:hypothetical protein